MHLFFYLPIFFLHYGYVCLPICPSSDAPTMHPCIYPSAFYLLNCKSSADRGRNPVRAAGILFAGSVNMKNRLPFDLHITTDTIWIIQVFFTLYVWNNPLLQYISETVILAFNENTLHGGKVKLVGKLYHESSSARLW